MKRNIFFIFCFLLLLSSCKKDRISVSGVFDGISDGLIGPITVRVTIEKNKIKDINVLEYSDTPGYSDAVFDCLPKKVIASNSTEIDCVSGATITAKAFLSAVNDALYKAGVCTFD